MEGSSNNNNNNNDNNNNTNEMIMSPPPPTTPSPCSSQGGPNSPPPPPPPCSAQQGAAGGPPIIMSPCAACKILRRRCAEKCVLAPYFPPTDPLKFTIAHKVFGASNIIKLLQELPESQRADAVSSMVYEANARLRDPVYGSAGAICQLQQQVSELQAELAKSRAEIVNLQCQHANLLALICMEMTTQSQSNGVIPTSSSPHNEQNQSSPSNTSFLNYFYDDNNTTLSSLWEPLWT